MGMNGNRIIRSQAGKLFAVLWILTAALAMQFVASAQGLSSRFSTQQNAGNIAGSDSGTSDTTLSRQVVRAFPTADLRFTTERSDGKASPGGPGPLVLPTPFFVASVSYGSMTFSVFLEGMSDASRRDHVRVRGPPAFFG